MEFRRHKTCGLEMSQKGIQSNTSIMCRGKIRHQLGLHGGNQVRPSKCNVLVENSSLKQQKIRQFQDMWVETGGASKRERNFNNHMHTYSKTLAHHAQLLGTTLGSSWPQSREFAYSMLWNGWSLGTTMRRGTR